MEWEVTNYRSVVLSRPLGSAPSDPARPPIDPAGG